MGVACGAACLYTGYGPSSLLGAFSSSPAEAPRRLDDAGDVLGFQAPGRSLHGPGTEAANESCYGGLTYMQHYEDSVIGPFQVLTQKKYMLTIYGCAVGGQPEKSICLRENYVWMLPAYVVGILYMFCGLAIICDEFFVPALELFTENLGVTKDVAGATFMAAGGSMPELFASLIGTFNETDVGFAAIIGSAVFNVLFVIAVCTLASDEPLQLTWWPLFRDVSWYLLALALVAFVFKATSPNEIETWEAGLLFLTYCAYCTFMKFNPQLEAFFNKREASEEGPVGRAHSVIQQDVEGRSLADAEGAAVAHKMSVSEAAFVKPSTFRVGIFQLLTQNAHISETAGMHAVMKIKGNLQQTYARFDKDGDGLLSEEEVLDMLNEFGMTDRSAAALAMLKRIEPRTGDGSISFAAFQKWYMASEARVCIEVQKVFEFFDVDKSGTIDRKEIRDLLKTLGHHPSEGEVTTALREMNCIETTSMSSIVPSPEAEVEVISSGLQTTNLDDIQITFEKFEKWYQQSMFWQELHKQHINEAAAEGQGFNIDFPEDPTRVQLAWFIFTYPVAAMMYCTMPDVRREGSDTTRIALLEFLCSLCWIAFFSLCLYDWLVTISNTIGFPPEVAAVTILAGGTSIPDLLSSYVVARQGEGDMAVSSSIGSNIFDVTVGLPLPWFLFTVINGKNVQVESGSLFSSIIILMLMLSSVIATVMYMNWKMTKQMGAVMMALYVLFIIQQLMQDFGVINYGIG